MKIGPMQPSLSDFIVSVFQDHPYFLLAKKKRCCKNGLVSSISNEVNPGQTLTDFAHLFGQMFILHCFHFLAEPKKLLQNLHPGKLTASPSKIVVGRLFSFCGPCYFQGRFGLFQEGSTGSEKSSIFQPPTPSRAKTPRSFTKTTFKT